MILLAQLDQIEIRVHKLKSPNWSFFVEPTRAANGSLFNVATASQ